MSIQPKRMPQSLLELERAKVTFLKQGPPGDAGPRGPPGPPGEQGNMPPYVTKRDIGIGVFANALLAGIVCLRLRHEWIARLEQQRCQSGAIAKAKAKSRAKPAASNELKEAGK